MTNITLDEVIKIARLAKLEITDAEAKKLQSEIGSILGYVKQLEDVDTEGVEPTSQVTGLVNSVRNDEIIDYGVSRAELFENVPEKMANYIKVRKVL